MRQTIFLVGLILLAQTPNASAQVVGGRVDNFQAGSTLGWTNGGVNLPVNIATGGPNGSGDRFLQIMADGSGAGGHMVAFNRTRWSGNFVSAGVTSVAADLKVTLGGPLKMRIALKSGTGISDPGYVTTTPVDLPADGAWHHAVFGLDSGSLTGVNGPTPLNTFLQSVVEFRLLSAVVIAKPMPPSICAVSVLGLTTSPVSTAQKTRRTLSRPPARASSTTSAT